MASSCGSNGKEFAINRLKNDLNEWKNNPPTGFRLIRGDSNNPQRYEIEVRGAPETIYANETYQLEVVFPDDYPMNAPKVIFKQPVPVHPHVYSNGHICLDALSKGWTSAGTLKSICESIATMLYSTSVKGPKESGKNCAVLVGGSKGCNNYGHQGLSKLATNRLNKELDHLKNNLPNGFTLTVSDDNLKRWDIEVRGAPETLYANEPYHLEIQFPDDYPMNAPEVIFKHPVPIHPQVFRDGHIRSDALYYEWSPAVTLKSICERIETMLSSTSVKEKPIDLANLRVSTRKGPKESGKNWAVLVAGSKDWKNYRHQANVCRAYQLLRKRGLRDENIIVFMYDDIATHRNNDEKGKIINQLNGENVYAGVPKDYTLGAVTARNFYNVLLGLETKRGSGKVLQSGPNDNIFIYYTDHGNPGSLEMPQGETVDAKEFIKTLKKMHKLKKYHRMVIFVSACCSGSMFKDLKGDLNIYAMTSANFEEKSHATYDAPKNTSAKYLKHPARLSDHFSSAWLQYSESHDISKVTLADQYKAVKKRVKESEKPSEVSQFGAIEEMQDDYLLSYIGSTN